MKGNLSTRMAAALRHAGHHLLKQPGRKKRIFGENNNTIMDNMDRLSEKLPTLLASLTPGHTVLCKKYK